MKRSSVVNRSFFRRPAVRDLVPDLKLILVVMTISCESHVGVWRPGGLAEDAGLDPAALAGALADLTTRGHIVADNKTGEIMLTAFFRDNTFSGPQRIRQAIDDYKLIESEMLREMVVAAVEKNPGCGLKKACFLENQQVSHQGEGEGKQKKQQHAPAREASAVVVVFQDNSSLAHVPAALADDLRDEVAAAQPTASTHAAYASGILKNWLAAGGVASGKHKKQQQKQQLKREGEASADARRKAGEAAAAERRRRDADAGVQAPASMAAQLNRMRMARAGDSGAASASTEVG